MTRPRNNILVKQSTTPPTTTISSQTFYQTYIFADDALFSVFLGENPDSGKENYRQHQAVNKAVLIKLNPAMGTDWKINSPVET